ncbi:MAG: DUF975 family protein [Defluviitaleaceae bacterium]|nr:DUF975 family protein [Defluviitaleaceae bacterium]
MLTRQEMKANARLAMKQQRGVGIFALILFMLVVTVVLLLSGVIGLVFSHTVLVGGLISPVIIAFTILPLTVGMYGVFIKVYRHEATHATEIFHGFSHHYLRNVGGMLWVVLWVTIWALISLPLPVLGVLVGRALGGNMMRMMIILSLVGHFALLIPALIKALSYAMVPYLLADAPDIKVREAMRLSMRMTKGHKGALVVMYLSFIGWFILSPLTLGILALVYVNPYLYTSLAGFYSGLKQNALEKGIIAQHELVNDEVIVEEVDVEMVPN